MSLLNKVFVAFDFSFSDKEVIEQVMSEIKEEYSIAPDKSCDEDESFSKPPTIFIRDCRNDLCMRGFLSSLGFRIVHCRSDWENDENAGISRNSKIFTFNPSHVYIFSSGIKNDSIEHVMYLSFLNKVKLSVIEDETQTDYFPENLDEYPIRENRNFVEKNDTLRKLARKDSAKYKQQMEESKRRIRKMYYESLKERPSTKLITDDEITQMYKKKQINTKAKRKKMMKQKKKDSKKTVKVDETIKVESYD